MYKLSITFIVFLFLPLQAFAASFSLTAPETVNRGESFQLHVFLDTEGESVNAIEGRITLPSGISFNSVRYQGSVVSLWLEAPEKPEAGEINFAGVIPAGYSGNPEKTGNGSMFTLVLTAHTTGSFRVHSEEGAAYLNDGEGTSVRISRSSVPVESVENGAPNSDTLAEDTYPPESFTPERVPGEPYGFQHDALVFATQDKDSGVAGYEYASSLFRFTPEFLLSFNPAESPLALSAAEEEKYLFVRVFDYAGNTRVAVVPPVSGITATLATWLIPLLVLVAVILAALRLGSRFGVFLKR